MQMLHPNFIHRKRIRSFNDDCSRSRWARIRTLRLQAFQSCELLLLDLTFTASTSGSQPDELAAVLPESAGAGFACRSILDLLKFRFEVSVGVGGGSVGAAACRSEVLLFEPFTVLDRSEALLLPDLTLVASVV